MLRYISRVYLNSYPQKMALRTLLDDFPVNFGHRCCRFRRLSPLPSFINREENPTERIIRGFPSFVMELEDILVPKANRRMIQNTGGTDKEAKEKELVTIKDNRLQVHLNAKSFEPEDITVKVIGDQLEVTAKHEMQGNNGYEYHEIYRRFQLPDGVDSDSMTSHLTSTGQLTIEAPVKQKDNLSEKIVQVVRENDDAVSDKNDAVSDEKETPAINKDKE